MIPIRKFIISSSILMLFSDRLVVTIGVNIYLFYFLVIINICLLWSIKELWVPKGAAIFLAVLFVSGVVGLSRGTDSLAGFTKDYVGMAPLLIFACSLLHLVRFDVEDWFSRYARGAFVVALIGCIISPYQMLEEGRLRSVLAEPSSFCLVCVPALYYYADRWRRTHEHGWRVIVLAAACALTYSSLGYLGMLMGLYLLGTRYKFGTLFAPLLIAIISVGLYTQSYMFQTRMDDTLHSLQNGDLNDINISSYGVVSNVFVTRKAFAEHPLMGGGLGSYVVAHDRFANQLVGIQIFQLIGFGDLSRWDASSLLLRVTAEFGLMGICVGVWFLFHFWPKGSTDSRKGIANALLCYVFMKLLRNGGYINAETPLFFTIYAVNGILAKAERKQKPVVTGTPANLIDQQTDVGTIPGTV